jgi:multidrug resistance efflux pump
MVELILGTYGALCWLVFKKFKLIPLNTYTGTGAALVGVGLLGFLFLMLGTYQPSSGDGRLYAATTPIISNVRGKVTAVAVGESQEVKQGDVLMQIDPTPYQAVVDRLTSQLATAEADLGRAKTLLKQGVGRQMQVDEQQARVDAFKGQLAEAQFDLDSCTVRAPADGSVTQVIVRPGQMAVPMPFAPLMVFVHGGDPALIASFPQQTIKTIQPGHEVELSFDAYPGYIFKGTVKRKLSAVPEGQLLAAGQLRATTNERSPGRIPVIVDYGDDVKALGLPVGAKVTVAVYTDEFAWLGILRKIILRIKSWESYLFIP